LTDEATASQASDIMKELINHYIDPKEVVINESQSLDDSSQESEEANMIKSTCAVLENILNSCDGIPNEHLLGVISVLFKKLGTWNLLFFCHFSTIIFLDFTHNSVACFKLIYGIQISILDKFLNQHNFRGHIAS
jgi:hypothetical protein